MFVRLFFGEIFIILISEKFNKLVKVIFFFLFIEKFVKCFIGCLVGMLLSLNF